MGDVTVLGGTLAGIAAAVRLAKAGHAVTLVESGQLGGRWVARQLAPSVLVDAAPVVLDLPAAWRDLFKKSGRPLDAELARSGLTLVPAPASLHEFADGSSLTLPAERGQQFAALADAYGTSVAEKWRDLLDHYDAVWLALRPLGLEGELTGKQQLTRPVKALLQPRRSVEEVARALREPHLAALVRSVAWQHGSSPQRLPAWFLARLSVERTFGQWMLLRDGIAQPVSTLLELLAGRLAQRQVRRAPSTPARADAVVDARDPAPTRRLRPALAPTVTHRLSIPVADCPALTQTVVHTSTGPVVHAHRLLSDGRAVHTVHDHAHSYDDMTFGVAWRGWRTLLALPQVRTPDPHRFTASAASPAGNELWAQLLSAALVSYAVHETLTGEDIRPTNKALGRRGQPTSPR